MYIKKEISDFDALFANSWSGALPVLREIAAQGKEGELMSLLEEVFSWDYDEPTETQVNDFIWFEVGDLLHLWDEEEEEEEEEEE